MTTLRVVVPIFVFAVIIGSIVSQKLASTPGGLPSPAADAPVVAISAPTGFSGAWKAAEPGTLPTRLIIMNADQYSASILYNWGDGTRDSSWLHARAKVLADGKLRWGSPGSFTVELSPDGQTLIGERE
jgi:hypothetical protein